MDVDADVEVIPAPDSQTFRYQEALGVEDLVTEVMRSPEDLPHAALTPESEVKNSVNKNSQISSPKIKSRKKLRFDIYEPLMISSPSISIEMANIINNGEKR